MNKNQRPLDISTAIEFMDTSVRSDVDGFFINTDLGKIAVEVTHEDYEVLNPIEIYPWQHAPATRWCMMNRNEDAVWYVSYGIDVRASRTWIHMKSVEAMTKIIFTNFVGTAITQDLVDAGVLSYLRSIDHKVITVNFIEDEFCRTALSLLVRSNDTVREIVRQNIQYRIKNANTLIENATGYLYSRGICDRIVNIGESEYNTNMVSLITYAKMSLDRVLF